MLTKMSVARLNDLCYLTLKKLFFEPMFGEGHSPRECDIRVVMVMVEPAIWKGEPLMAAILSPTEVAPKSHEEFYEVDTDKVFSQAVEYMEDHWLKSSIEEVFTQDGSRDSMKEWFESRLVPVVMEIPEDQCAKQEAE